jgi:hypothetical protein
MLVDGLDEEEALANQPGKLLAAPDTARHPAELHRL